MPHKPHFIDDADAPVKFKYECWKDVNTGEGMIAVEGATDKDHLYLINNRVDMMNTLKAQESLDSMRYFESQRNGRHTELAIEANDRGLVTSGRMIGAGISNAELSKQGADLLDQEHSNNIDLSKQEISRKKNPPGHIV